MTPKQYLDAVQRTVPPNMSEKELLTMAALGMAGEASEIAAYPTSEEIGDGYWYAYVMLDLVGAKGRSIRPIITGTGTKYSPCYYAARICERVKKVVFHEHPLTCHRDTIRYATERYIDELCAIDPQHHTETFDQNIAKLTKRYPQGFEI